MKLLWHCEKVGKNIQFLIALFLSDFIRNYIEKIKDRKGMKYNILAMKNHLKDLNKFFTSLKRFRFLTVFMDVYVWRRLKFC